MTYHCMKNVINNQELDNVGILQIMDVGVRKNRHLMSYFRCLNKKKL